MWLSRFSIRHSLTLHQMQEIGMVIQTFPLHGKIDDTIQLLIRKIVKPLLLTRLDNIPAVFRIHKDH